MPTDGGAAPVPGAVPGGRAESHEFSTLTGERADPEALGWSRGGLSTKIHLLAPYRQRNVVERAAKKLRGTRAVATRYDKARLRLLRHHRRRRHQDLATRPTPTRYPGRGLVGMDEAEEAVAVAVDSGCEQQVSRRSGVAVTENEPPETAVLD